MKSNVPFMLTHAITADPVLEFAAEVRAGLTRPGQKELPSKYLYDDVGSALFEVISVLPQYGLTRADERLLRRHAHEIVEQVPGRVAVAELGSGSGKKTRWLLQALCRRQHVSYFPIEISPTALAMCERELGDIDCMSIVGFEREYLDGLVEVAARRRDGQNLLVLFLGSTIGNFDRPAASKFLREMRMILQPGDSCCWAQIWKSRFTSCWLLMTTRWGSRSPKGKPSGPRAAISIVPRNCRTSPKIRAFSAKHSGLTRNGLSPRTCSSRHESAFWPAFRAVLRIFVNERLT